MPLPLPRALEAVLASADAESLRRATSRLVEVYRSGAPPAAQVLADPVAATAYAAYRMPATHAALVRILRDADRLGALDGVRSLLDLGGGTGAAAWAAADTMPGLESATVLDGSADALALGRQVARHGPPAVAGATWVRADLGALAGLPAADLVTISYVLGELADPLHGPLLDAAMGAGGLVLVAEPGTPRGFAAVLAARDRLVAAGWHLVAPCPQPGPCPVAQRDGDWCHFSARLDRSALHRRLKGATLGHEDEKYSYLLASREPLSPSLARVLRHPQTRKGMVTLEVCRADGTAGPEVVTKRDRERYRAARDAAWGDPWRDPGR
ncbi:small ribosomal subunit Rsm22 family protein [uncultured Phycicoccus sp.]|uniref:small ribosomal subunit Rsm22 family protein n=1 Tax=uncultured Phycicoccus sp. TaxID=661422 RepID=UPI00262374DD|nr:small ribosomal subunit Rsm22 family protein [uncultured Phycicoccus sp.]